MRNVGIGADESCADRLLIGANQADIGGGESSSGHGLTRQYTLPRSGSHHAFAKNSFWTEPNTAPAIPGAAFRSVCARSVPCSVNEQFFGGGFAELMAHDLRGLRAAAPR